MKSLTFAAIALALSAPHAHANMNYDCAEQGGSSRLLVHTFMAEGPNVVADWNYGEGTRLANSVHFTGSGETGPSLGGYIMTDADGNSAMLTLKTTPVFHHPCGRGGCDFDGATHTTAILKYQEKELDFVCQ